MCATANRGEGGKTYKGAKLPFHGKILFVGCEEIYEIEDRLWELEPEWPGKENSKILERGQEYLLNGARWDYTKKG